MRTPETKLEILQAPAALHEVCFYDVHGRRACDHLCGPLTADIAMLLLLIAYDFPPSPSPQLLCGHHLVCELGGGEFHA